jgi:uncharacterized protein with HEPN domain
MRSDAVLYQLVIIGEAVRQIPAAVRDRHPEIDWRRVVGMRDVVVNGYHRVELSIVWSIATQELDPLQEVIERLMREPGASGGEARR